MNKGIMSAEGGSASGGKNNNVVHSLGHAVLVAVYVSFVAFVMSHASYWFGPKDTAWTPVAVIMLFVLSATITATLVLGRPVLLYVDGKKQEAVKFFGFTVMWLFVLTIVAFVVLAVAR